MFVGRYFCARTASRLGLPSCGARIQGIDDRGALKGGVTQPRLLGAPNETKTPERGEAPGTAPRLNSAL
jgi:hypothetical protein